MYFNGFTLLYVFKNEWSRSFFILSKVNFWPAVYFPTIDFYTYLVKNQGAAKKYYTESSV
ncbi:hypothetical protein CN912_21965 [Bacillus cereus]|nr:hypothetical protein CN484_14980 [Bacillus cereus]PFR33719.1 hypothetical protein COK20_27525 [Bacillus cereus]PGL06894.1 hypothetical protein CN912_21965 [Bacillus cereus]